MADALDVRQKQRAVFEFLCCENETVGNIHQRLKRVYRDDDVDRRTVNQLALRVSCENRYANIEDRGGSIKPV